MFKLYLDGLITEAVSEKHAGRVVEILQNRIARKFGMQVYVQNGTCKIKKEGEGIVFGTMFMLDDGKHAFRLNWKADVQSVNIHSIDFWIKPAANPQLTAFVNNLSIVEVVKLIDEVINKQAKGQVDLSEVDDVPVSEAENPNSFAARYRAALASGDEAKIQALKDEYKQKRAQKKMANVVPAPPEQMAAKQPDQWSELFDEPLSSKEIFALMEDAINKVKSGVNKSILITGDPGIGKCVYEDVDLNCRFF